MDISHANERAAEANKIAEDEKLARIKLEAQIAPRRLTKEQQAAITADCSIFKGKRVQVLSYSLDPEGFVLAEQIVAAFRSSGMAVDDDAFTITPGGNITFGVAVFGQEPKLSRSIASILSKQGNLGAAAMDTDPTQNSIKIVFGKLPPHAAVILVGLKPLEGGIKNFQ